MEDNLSILLDEAERTAIYNGLEKKQMLHLRLLCEELICMLPELLEYSDARFWIESEGKSYYINVALTASNVILLDEEKLLAIATSKKNSARGILNAIKSVVYCFIAQKNSLVTFTGGENEYYDMGHCNNAGIDGWTLNEYRESAKKDLTSKTWDELEKSIIAGIADDVRVEIIGDEIAIRISKKFA